MTSSTSVRCPHLDTGHKEHSIQFGLGFGRARKRVVRRLDGTESAGYLWVMVKTPSHPLGGSSKR